MVVYRENVVRTLEYIDEMHFSVGELNISYKDTKFLQIRTNTHKYVQIGILCAKFKLVEDLVPCLFLALIDVQPHAH